MHWPLLHRNAPALQEAACVNCIVRGLPLVHRRLKQSTRHVIHVFYIHNNEKGGYIIVDNRVLHENPSGDYHCKHQRQHFSTGWLTTVNLLTAISTWPNPSASGRRSDTLAVGTPKLSGWTWCCQTSKEGSEREPSRYTYINTSLSKVGMLQTGNFVLHCTIIIIVEIISINEIAYSIQFHHSHQYILEFHHSDQMNEYTHYCHNEIL